MNVRPYPTYVLVVPASTLWVLLRANAPQDRLEIRPLTPAMTKTNVRMRISVKTDDASIPMEVISVCATLDSSRAKTKHIV